MFRRLSLAISPARKHDDRRTRRHSPYARWPFQCMSGAVLLFVASLSVGCISMTIGETLEAPAEAPPPIAKIPLTVGIYYSHEFRTYEHVRNGQSSSPPFYIPAGLKILFPAGKNSVVLFDQAMSQLFLRVVPVSTLQANSTDLAAIIEPRIEDFDFAMTINFSYEPAYVIYRLTLYSPQGVPFASWMVTGKGANKSVWEFDRRGKASNRALQDGVKNVVTSFSTVPEVKAWLHSKGMQDAQ
jgi:hypothetical protein